MATISNQPRPGYAWDAQDNVWYPIGTGTHSHNEIAKTIVDAKGDIIAGTANDTVDRLAVGANNLVLTADSTQATGLKWAAPDPLTTKGDLFTYSTTETRLGVGANDTVLTADSTTATGLKWATPSSGGATLLSTTSLTGATTTISSISGSYKNLYGIISGVTNATANGRFQILVNGSTSAHSFWSMYGASVTNWKNLATVWDLGYFNAGGSAYITFDRTSNLNTFYFEIKNYASSTAYKPINSNGYYVGEGDTWPTGQAGAYIATTAVTSLQFRNTGGNLSTGTVLLYGVN